MSTWLSIGPIYGFYPYALLIFPPLLIPISIFSFWKVRKRHFQPLFSLSLLLFPCRRGYLWFRWTFEPAVFEFPTIIRKCARSLAFSTLRFHSLCFISYADASFSRFQVVFQAETEPAAFKLARSFSIIAGLSPILTQIPHENGEKMLLLPLHLLFSPLKTSTTEFNLVWARCWLLVPGWRRAGQRHQRQLSSNDMAPTTWHHQLSKQTTLTYNETLWLQLSAS